MEKDQANTVDNSEVENLKSSILDLLSDQSKPDIAVREAEHPWEGERGFWLMVEAENQNKIELLKSATREINGFNILETSPHVATISCVPVEQALDFLLKVLQVTGFKSVYVVNN